MWAQAGAGLVTVENIFIAKHALEIYSHNTAKKVKDIRSVEKMRATYSRINRVQGTPLAAPSRVQNSDA